MLDTHTLLPFAEQLKIPKCEACGELMILIGDEFACLNCQANAEDADETTREPGLLPLWDFQQLLFDKAKAAFLAGHRTVLINAPTGSGKTVVATHVINASFIKGRRCYFLADRINLVDQASKQLVDAGIPHGIAQSNNTRDRDAPIQIVSIQTAQKRGYLSLNPPDLIVVDEAHIMPKQVVDAINTVKSGGTGRVLGLTATPLTKGLGSLYDTVISGESTTSLINRGYLVPLTVFPMTEMDMKGAKTDKEGEYTNKSVEERGTRIIGDIVREWKEKTQFVFGCPRPTLVFTATVEQGRILRDAFCNAGFPFEQISYNDGRSPNERKRILKRFRRGELIGLISCEALTRGFDAPIAEVLVVARPYKKSLAAHIQMLGRVMRISPKTNKTRAIVIDHTGNWDLWYEKTMDFFDFGVDSRPKGKDEAAEIKSKPKKKDQDDDEPREPRKCPKCSASMPPLIKVCTACGYEFPKRTTIAEVEGTAKRMDHVGSEQGRAADGAWVWNQVCREAMNTHPRDDRKAQKRARMFYNLITKRASKGLPFNHAPGPVHPDIENHVQRLRRAYAIRKSYARRNHAKKNRAS